MTKDPFIKPLNLAAVPGKWKYTDEEKQYTIDGYDFWETAKKLWVWRARNNRPRATFELAQLDLLMAKRRELGLPNILRETQEMVDETTPLTVLDKITREVTIRKHRPCCG